MFKKKRQTLPSKPVEYPPGSFVKTERGYFYIASQEKRYRFLTERVAASWRPHRIIVTSEKALARYRIAAKMRFRNGSLIHNIADGKIYLVSDGKRRHIVSPEVLTRIGATGKDVVTVSLDEIKLHKEGEPLE